MNAREQRAQAAAAAAVERAQAHTDDWPEPIPDQPRQRYPVTPEIARAIRLEHEERNAAR